jgi:hypothetical protein
VARIFAFGERWDVKEILTSEAASNPSSVAAAITDKRGYAARWKFSARYIDSLLSRGLPHLKIGERRVRIVIEEADLWMREKFFTQRCKPANAIQRPAMSIQLDTSIDLPQPGGVPVKAYVSNASADSKI